MSTVVLGATGRLGHQVVRGLLDRGAVAQDVLAVGRQARRLAELAELGVRVSAVEYDDEAAVRDLLHAGDTLLLISGSDTVHRRRQHRTIIEAARQADVARVVYTSVMNAEDPTLLVGGDHVVAEKLIRDSGLRFTILRNAWYTENFGLLLEHARTHGQVVASAGDGRMASACRADLAVAAAAVLLGGTEHDGRTYELGGDHPWSFDEFAEACAEVIGRDVTHRRVTTEHHIAILGKAGLSAWDAQVVATFDLNIRDGVLSLCTGELTRLIGRPTTPLVDTLRVLNDRLNRREAAAAGRG
jgi:NAD(P)H dehydrogenase (quinone)